MNGRLAASLALKSAPVAVIMADEKPADSLQFKEDKQGCVAAMLLAATRGLTAVFDRRTFGCPGGGTGLGFGNCYTGFPIDRLLSTGGQAVLPNGYPFDMGEGERFFESPEITKRWVKDLPYHDVPTEYIVFKPLDQAAEKEQVALVIMLVNADQLSALVTLAGYRRGAVETVICPWGAACQSIMFSLAEAEKETPRGVIGFFDISQRNRVGSDTLSFTIPFRMYLEMESNVENSFLRTEMWQKLRVRA